MFIDSHCHLDFPDLVGRKDEVLARMAANGVDQALCVSVTLEAFPNVLALAHEYPHLFASVGVHPDNAECEEPDVERLLTLADDPKVIAIGETGLDYYWQKDEPEWQRDRFRTHIRASRACGKPLIIHTRSAAADTIRLMREAGAEMAGDALDLGFYISFSGIVTFKNAKPLKEVARRVPLERMLIETDAPYLAPVPHRGKTNEPGFVKHVAEEIANLRGVAVEAIAEQTSNNFRNLFKVS